MIVNVLGSDYAVMVTNEAQEPRLKNKDGFCDDTSKEIFVEDYKTVSHEDSKRNLLLQTKKVLRHELVHAFLFESGLAENSGWAQNEELVDWIAIQGPKLLKAWQEAGAL